LRSSEALTGIVIPRIIRSFRRASAWASSMTKVSAGAQNQPARGA
jgi:energy-coupling factor transporter transmembrane protein EcfT